MNNMLGSLLPCSCCLIDAMAIMFSPTLSGATSSPSPTSTSDDSDDSGPTECPTCLPSNQPEYVKAQLERLSMQTVDLIAKRHFSNSLLQCFSPNLKCVYEGVTINTGRDAIFKHLAQVSEQCPDWRAEAVDALAEVDLRRGRAKVWMRLVVRGLPRNIMRGGVRILCWERRDDVWICWKQVGLGGVQMFT